MNAMADDLEQLYTVIMLGDGICQGTLAGPWFSHPPESGVRFTRPLVREPQSGNHNTDTSLKRNFP